MVVSLCPSSCVSISHSTASIVSNGANDDAQSESDEGLTGTGTTGRTGKSQYSDRVRGREGERGTDGETTQASDTTPDTRHSLDGMGSDQPRLELELDSDWAAQSGKRSQFRQQGRKAEN